MTNKNPNIKKVYYSIGEVAQMIGVNPSSIRYWEDNFTSLSPKKSPKGTRLFTYTDIEMVKLINYLVKELGLTIKGAQQKLKNKREETTITLEIIQRLKYIKQELTAIRDEMEEINNED